MRISIQKLVFSFVITSRLICQDQVLITISVTVPVGTNQVILVGNIPLLGNWDHSSALPLTMVDSTTFSGSFSVLRNISIEYKLTHGSWESEALTENRMVPGNTQLTVRGDTTITHTVAIWKDTGKIPGAGITGLRNYHRDFYSLELNNRRDIIVWLPPSYSTDSLARYPVLYMHDGQNIIDPFTSFAGQDWRMDEVATELIELGKIEEIIIVGINNTDNRTAEYSPLHLGEQYSTFMINTLKPFIDSTYRTMQKPEHTAVMGSSMGGIISFHLAWEYPQTFSMAGCLSPAFLIDDNEIINRIRNYSGPEKTIKLYIDNGTIGLEQRLQPAIDELVPLLNQISFMDEHHLLYYIADGAEHNEAAWAERVYLPLVFFFGH